MVNNAFEDTAFTTNRHQCLAYPRRRGQGRKDSPRAEAQRDRGGGGGCTAGVVDYLVAYAFERRGDEGQRRGEAGEGSARVQLAYEFVVGVQVVPTCVCVYGGVSRAGGGGDARRRVRMREEGIRGDGWARGLVVDYSGASLPVPVGDGGVHAFLQAQAVFVLGQRGVLIAVLAVVVVVDFRGRRGAPTPTAIGGR